MRNSLRIFALLLLVPVTNAQNIPDARAFVQRIYAVYEHPASIRDPDTLGKLAPSIFSPSLLHLIRVDQRINRGNAPELDWDPICDCQDFEGLRLTSLTVKDIDNKQASAEVTFQLFADDPKSTRSLRLNLLYTAQGWPIDDISNAGTPSIRKFLQKNR